MHALQFSGSAGLDFNRDHAMRVLNHVVNFGGASSFIPRPVVKLLTFKVRICANFLTNKLFRNRTCIDQIVTFSNPARYVEITISLHKSDVKKQQFSKIIALTGNGGVGMKT